MRIRLYLNKHNEDQGLWYGNNPRTRVCDDIWNRNSSGRHAFDPSSVWHAFYSRDQAGASEPWYALDINKFVVLT